MILSSITQLKDMPCRIISLVPSQTELLAYLCLDKSIIGITKFCVHPKEWETSKSIVGGTKNLNIEKIKKLQPDLIIANKEENTQEQIKALAADFNVWLTDVYDLESALQMINDIGKLTGTLPFANTLIKKIQTGFGQMEKIEKPVKTCYLIWHKPYMTVGGDTFISDMLLKCGLQNMYAPLSRYPEITPDELRLAKCELIILSSEPYPFQQKHADELQLQIPSAKIVLADGEMFSWYGSRVLYAPGYFTKLLRKIKIL